MKRWQDEVKHRECLLSTSTFFPSELWHTEARGRHGKRGAGSKGEKRARRIRIAQVVANKHEKVITSRKIWFQQILLKVIRIWNWICDRQRNREARRQQCNFQGRNISLSGPVGRQHRTSVWDGFKLDWRSSFARWANKAIDTNTKTVHTGAAICTCTISCKGRHQHEGNRGAEKDDKNNQQSKRWKCSTSTRLSIGRVETGTQKPPSFAGVSTCRDRVWFPVSQGREQPLHELKSDRVQLTIANENNDENRTRWT